MESHEDPPSSAEECDSYDAVLEGLQASRQFLMEHQKFFPELVKRLDEAPRDCLRDLADDVCSDANRLIAVLDNRDLWRRRKKTATRRTAVEGCCRWRKAPGQTGISHRLSATVAATSWDCSPSAPGSWGGAPKS